MLIAFTYCIGILAECFSAWFIFLFQVFGLRRFLRAVIFSAEFSVLRVVIVFYFQVFMATVL